MLPQDALFTGTQVNYYIICPTKLWLFSHFAAMERESELVQLGSLLQQTTFQRVRKDIIIDEKIGIDFIMKGNKLVLHEIKKSSKMEKAHVMQLLYYIYYLKKFKGIKNIEGRIDYPKQREVLRITLGEKEEREIEDILDDIRKVVEMKEPPKPVYKKYCRKCSYFEFCFV